MKSAVEKFNKIADDIADSSENLIQVFLALNQFQANVRRYFDFFPVFGSLTLPLYRNESTGFLNVLYMMEILGFTIPENIKEKINI